MVVSFLFLCRQSIGRKGVVRTSLDEMTGVWLNADLGLGVAQTAEVWDLSGRGGGARMGLFPRATNAPQPAQAVPPLAEKDRDEACPRQARTVI